MAGNHGPGRMGSDRALLRGERAFSGGGAGGGYRTAGFLADKGGVMDTETLKTLLIGVIMFASTVYSNIAFEYLDERKPILAILIFMVSLWAAIFAAFLITN